MKKLLSVFLAILMLFGAFTASSGVFAETKPTDGWYTSNNKKYYLVNSKYVKGFFVIGKDFYYFDPKDGSLQTNGWAKISVKVEGETKKLWIYSNTNGKLKEGWKKTKGKWYYLNPFMVDSDTCLVKGKIYVFESGGAMTTKKGWVSIDKKNRTGEIVRKWTYVKGDGVAVTGWQKIGKKWYYFNPETALMVEDGIQKIKNNYYYFNSNGSWAGTKTGWVKHLNDWYYITEGKASKGWKSVKNKWYFLDRSTCKMYADGPYNVPKKDGSKGSAYFFESSGKLTSKIGWVKYNLFDIETGKFNTGYVYVGSEGKCKTGWQKIGGKSYFLDNDNGEMYMNGGRNVTSGGKSKPYFFESSGALTSKTGWQTVTLTKYDNTKIIKKYYVDSGGICRTGLQKIGNETYCFDRDGKMLSNGVFVVNGRIYSFNADGALKKSINGLVNDNNYTYYFVNGEGQTGWQTVNGKKYYFDKTMGYMYKNGMFTVDGVVYEFDSAGNSKKV